MPQLSISKTYADGTTLFESDLDNIKDGLETFVNTTKLDSENIQDSAIVEAKIAAGAVTAAKIASNAVTTTKIADSNVTTAKIADANVTTVKIADSNVTTVKIADSNVTTEKIANEAVTQAKVKIRAMNSSTAGAGDIAISSSSGSSNVSSTAFTDIVSVTLTTLGGPVQLRLQPDSSASTSYIRANDTGSPFGYGEIAFVRVLSGTPTTLSVQPVSLLSASGIGLPPSSFQHVDVPAAGTYTYKIQARRTTDATSIDVKDVVLLAYEEG